MLVSIGWLPYGVLKGLIKLVLGIFKIIKTVFSFRNGRAFLSFGLTLTIVFSVFSVGVWWFWKEVLSDMPGIEKIYFPPALSTRIVDRNGKNLYVFYQNENRSWISLSQIPTHLIQATIAIEDKDFFTHSGFSVKSIVRALWANKDSKAGENLQGGSTITQQLVKNVFLSKEKSWRRKIREVILAVTLESKLSKEQILERYFNQVPYGGEIYGIQEASRKYFGKEVNDLNLAESSFLAGLPAAPSSYSPLSGIEFAKKRQGRVLEEMVKSGNISESDAKNVFSQNLQIQNDKTKIDAPHFVFYVKDILKDKFGYDKLGSEGVVVKTSLDLELQTFTDKVVSDEVGKVARLRIGNGSAMVVDVKNGDVLAMSGSKDYWAKDIDGKYNITTAERQPGSSIKPINYLNALMKGATLSTTIDDGPVSYKIPGQKPYAPQNYNGKYMGRVTLRTALASSLNIPSVKLLDRYGINSMIDLAQSMGINTWDDRSRFGLSLSLGAGEVKMTEISQAYSIFANMGEKIDINPVVSIHDYLGREVYQKKVSGKNIFDSRYAYLINSALSDDVARSPIFGRGSKLVIPGKTVAVKTGTTNSLRDNWAIGWTPSYLVAAWVGNNDNSPMSWVASGISGATPIWNRIMHQMIDKREDEKWEAPTGVVKARACGREDWFVSGSEKNVDCPPVPSVTPMP